MPSCSGAVILYNQCVFGVCFFANGDKAPLSIRLPLKHRHYRKQTVYTLYVWFRSIIMLNLNNIQYNLHICRRNLIQFTYFLPVTR